MSYEIATADGVKGQFASSGGYDAFVKAVPSPLKALKVFVKNGVTDNVPAVKEDLLAFMDGTTDTDLISTADTLTDLIDGEEAVTITNGEDPSDENVVKGGNGVMLAFWPPVSMAQDLAVSDGELPDELHVTLAYFGKLDEVPLDKLGELEATVEQFAKTHAPVKATLAGLGVFPATQHSDGKTVEYLNVDSPGLVALRKELVAAISHIVEPRSNFTYTPHMTLRLSDPDNFKMDAEPAPANVLFDEIVLSIGTAEKHYLLTGPDVKKIDFSFEIFKSDPSHHLVFGWASVVQVGDRVVQDTQGDRLSSDTIEESAYNYVLNARVSTEMHARDHRNEPVEIGRLVESAILTREKQQAMVTSLNAQGIPAVMNLGCVGWWIGIFIDDEDVWRRVVSGELGAFSVGGTGKREKVT